MRAYWNIDDASLKRWRRLTASLEHDAFVRERFERNIRRTALDLSKTELWRVMVGCQVTSMQRAGPTSKVSVFMRSGSPALSYEMCRKQREVEPFLLAELRRASLWRAKPIALNLTKALAVLEAGEWKQLIAQLRTLRRYTTKAKERAVAQYLQSGHFPGIGPKQSRNYIQWLGLSRYEIPIDSRMLKTLKRLGCNFVPSSSALGDENVYVFLQEAVQELAARLNIYPCVLDACVFANADRRDS